MPAKQTVQTWNLRRAHAQSPRLQMAIGVGLAMLIASGVGYRVLAARLTSLSGTIFLPRGTLNALPFQLGDWQGHDVKMDERIVQATDTEDHVNRTYVRVGNKHSVSLFLAYGVRVRDLLPHRPEVCYPGVGWTLNSHRMIELPTDEDSSTLPAQIHEFKRGGLDSSGVTVLNYYIVDGQYCPDVSFLRSKAWRPKQHITYVAQVQIASGGSLLRDDAEASVRAFAIDSAVAIREVIAHAVEKASPNEGPDLSQ